MAIGKAIGIPVAIGVVGGKVFLGHKYLEHRRRRARRRSGYGMRKSHFAKLSRSRQRGIIYYREKRLKELEGVHKRQKPGRRVSWS